MISETQLVIRDGIAALLFPLSRGEGITVEPSSIFQLHRIQSPPFVLSTMISETQPVIRYGIAALPFPLPEGEGITVEPSSIFQTS